LIGPAELDPHAFRGLQQNTEGGWSVPKKRVVPTMQEPAQATFTASAGTGPHCPGCGKSTAPDSNSCIWRLWNPPSVTTVQSLRY